MSWFQALILGLLQGLTEFLPVSSSGHLVIAQNLFHLSTPPVVFDILLHLATALAIIFVLWKQIISLKPKTIGYILLATIPAGIVGVALNSSIETLFSSTKLVSLALLFTSGLLFLSQKYFSPSNNSTITWKNSLIIGLFQAVAIIPGISRSGSTISAGIFTRLKSETAFNFSFLLALPAIFGAAILQFKDLNTFAFSSNDLLGFLAAFFSGLLALKLLRRFVSKGRFTPFAWYCLILGIISLFL